MRDKINITISANNEDPVFYLHNTITSIVEQNNLQNFDINLIIKNLSSQSINQELERLKKHNISIIDKTTSDPQYTLSIKSGTIISRTFLYKAVYFLKNNPALFVCPEYSFIKIKNKPTIATIINSEIPYNSIIPCLLDHTKSTSKDTILLSSIIKDTCSSHITTSITSLKKCLSFISLPLYSSSHYSSQAKTSDKTTKIKTVLPKLKKLCGRSKVLHKIYYKFTPHTSNNYPSPYISDAMRTELDQLSNINLDLKIYKTANFFDISKDFYKSILTTHNLYLTRIKPNLRYENYDYMLCLPWLIPGGIDLFAINYIKYLAKQLPNQNILVILTENSKKSLTDKDLNFPKNVDIIRFSQVLQDTDPEKHHQKSITIIYSLINIFNPSRIHIMASKDGYDCLIRHNNDIRSKNVQIIFSSYNFIVDKTGEYLGYTVHELPKSYKPGDIITTDNSLSKKLWVDHYGFASQDILIHKQLFLDYPKKSFTLQKNKPIKILWAAHIRPEKNPEILINIAEQLQPQNIEIYCYGMFDSSDWPNEQNPLTTCSAKNLHYCGPFSDFFNDIKLSDFSLFLYTSHTDGTPNIILEAALYGIPIVASSIGGIPDVLGESMYLVTDTHSAKDFTEKINDVLSHPEKATQDAQKIRAKLIDEHSEINFEKQIKEMLLRSSK